MAKTLGWGLIGTGKIADDRILPGINAFKGNKLVAVVSREQSRADMFAKKFGSQHAYTKYADMLANPDVLRRAAPSANEIDGKSTPQSFTALIAEDYKTWAEVAKVANIKPE
mgnify:CR=1 FL=1